MLVTANLKNAKLCGANLCGADFRGATVDGVDWRDAKYSSSTVWPEKFGDPVSHGLKKEW